MLPKFDLGKINYVCMYCLGTSLFAKPSFFIIFLNGFKYINEESEVCNFADKQYHLIVATCFEVLASSLWLKKSFGLKQSIDHLVENNQNGLC